MGNWDLHNGGNKVEIMNLNNLIWTEVAEYPFAPMLYEYSSVSLEDSVGQSFNSEIIMAEAVF